MATAAIAQVLLADTQAAKSGELQLLLLPLIGAMLSAGATILLNPNPDTRNITIGRSIFALLGGIAAPQFVGLIHPALNPEEFKPVILLMVGAISASITYVLSKAFVRGAYARAEGIAQRKLDQIEQRYAPVIPVPPAPSPPSQQTTNLNVTVSGSEVKPASETSKIIVPLLAAMLFVCGCETIPVKASGCYTLPNGIKACASYSSKDGIVLEANKGLAK